MVAERRFWPRVTLTVRELPLAVYALVLCRLARATHKVRSVFARLQLILPHYQSPRPPSQLWVIDE